MTPPQVVPSGLLCLLSWSLSRVFQGKEAGGSCVHGRVVARRQEMPGGLRTMHACRFQLVGTTAVCQFEVAFRIDEGKVVSV